MELFDILTVDNVKTTATDVGEVMETIATLTTPSREAGRYVFAVAFVARFPDTNNSMRWQVTGNDASPEFGIEHKDIDDFAPLFYAFELDHAGGVFTADFQAMKTGGVALLDFEACNLSFLRVG